MHVVVTGASGFLGRAVVRRLHDAGVSVTALSRSGAPGTRAVADYALAPAADALVHLAETNDRARLREAGSTHERDAARTLQALLAPRRRIVYASSAVLYGDRCETPCDTRAALKLDDPYSRMKHAGEQAVLAHGGVAARLANLFGPGMSAANVVTAILGQVPGDGPLQVLDAAPVRDFLWVDDAAAALAAMALGKAGGVFNVGTGRGTSIHDLARTALELAGQPERPVLSTRPADRRSTLVVDIGATCAAFGWRPMTTLRDGLAALLRTNSQGQTCASAR